jgi:subtilisin family serine protease
MTSRIHVPTASLSSVALALILFVGPVATLASGSESEFEASEVIVVLSPGESIDGVNERWGTTILDAYPEGDLYLLSTPDSLDSEQWADALEEDPAIEMADANYFQRTPEATRQMVLAAVGGTSEDFEDQEIAQRIGLDEIHLHTLGAGITVAVLDTGVDPNHPVLASHLSPDGMDFVDMDAEPWEERNGVDDDGDGTVDTAFGHGTMVAGIIALVAPEATILPIRTLNDEGQADVFTVLEAFRYAVLAGADVLNLSFGTPTEIEILAENVLWASQMGATVVAAAGNRNLQTPAYEPASDEKAFMVAALDSLDIKADFSDYCGDVTVSAPGVGVRSSYPEDDWAIGHGCSFATPFVSGEVALILNLDPDADWEEVHFRLETAVEDVYSIPENEPYQGRLGAGRIYLPLIIEEATVGRTEPSGVVSRMEVYPNPSSGVFYGRGSAPPDRSDLRLTIHDATGRTIRSLKAPSKASPLLWDGRDGDGRRVASGVYYLRSSRPGTVPNVVKLHVLR